MLSLLLMTFRCENNDSTYSDFDSVFRQHFSIEQMHQLAFMFKKVIANHNEEDSYNIQQEEKQVSHYDFGRLYYE